MRISELARRANVSTTMLRRYEGMGLIRAERTAGGYREFADSTVREVVFIRMSRELGVPLAAIADHLPAYRHGTLSIDAMVQMLRQRVDEVDAQIAQARALRKRLVTHIAWLHARRRPPSTRPNRKKPT
jgi:MerR family transcriptional regulator, copper efflux regulator